MIKPGKIIIVGGNAAGPAAAAKAKRTNPESDVVMYEAGNFISTGTCEIPYVLSGEIKNTSEIIFFNAESFKRVKGVDVYVKNKVEEIHRKEKIILIRNLTDNNLSEVKYDKLILTTGSKAKTVPGFPLTAHNVFTLKSVGDFLLLKNYLETNKVKTAAVIGAGYLGLEAVDALTKLNIKASLFEKENQPLPSSSPEIGSLVKELLRNKEVEFWNNAKSIKLHLSEISASVKSIELDGRILEYDIYITAAGFTPNTELAVSSKLEIGKTGAVKIDNKLKTSDPHIFAAGDNVEVINAITLRPDYIPLASVAHEFGHAAGENAAGGNIHVEPVIKNLSVKIFDNYFITVGLNLAEAEAYGFSYKTVTEIVPNLIKVMPQSSNVFGQLIYGRNNKNILGACFFGGKEVSGFGDLISLLIKLRQPANILSQINYNYTPPLSPMVNLLSVLGRKIK